MLVLPGHAQAAVLAVEVLDGAGAVAVTAVAGAAVLRLVVRWRGPGVGVEQLGREGVDFSSFSPMNLTKPLSLPYPPDISLGNYDDCETISVPTVHIQAGLGEQPGCKQ